MTLVPPVSGRRGLIALSAVLGAVLVFAAWSWRSRPQPKASAPLPAVEKAEPSGVSALGRLNPAGNVRRLDAPSGAMGAAPRVEKLFVEEGDRVSAGQVLAQFDNHRDQLADFEVAKATIASLEQRQALLQEEVLRYEKLLQSGAISAENLDVRKIKQLTFAWAAKFRYTIFLSSSVHELPSEPRCALAAAVPSASSAAPSRAPGWPPR